MGGAAFPKIHTPPRMCYRVKLDCSARKDVRTDRMEPEIVERLDVASLGWGVTNI